MEQDYALPTQQPYNAEPYAASPLGYAARAKAAGLRAYGDAAARSFGARGELSSDLDAINQLEDFDYSPEALQYLQAQQAALTGYTGPYNLSSMDLHQIDPQTGAAMPYTSSYLEQAAARGDPLSRSYASFDPSTGQSAYRNSNTIQFDPTGSYRLVDRSTGNVVSSGTGWDAGRDIVAGTKAIGDDKGAKANWDVQRQVGDVWNSVRDHDPETSGFGKFLMMAAPFATMGLLSGLGVLGGAAGGIGGSAHAGIGATIGAGGLANAAPGLAALGGSTLAGAAGLAAPALGAGALGSLAAPITVIGPAAGGISAGTLAGLGGLAAGTTAATGGLGGGAANSAATQPAPTPNEIVVNAPTSTVPGGLPVDITGGALAGIGAGVGAIAPGAMSPTPAGSSPSTLSQISKYLELAGYGTGILGALFGGKGGGSGSAGTIPGGFGGVNPVFKATLPQANLPGVGDMSPRVMPQQDWNTYAMRPEQSFFNYVPQNVQGYADGGDVRGPGTGRSDSIPAALSDGEYVMDAETVALLGDGSTDAGADMLDQFRINIRKHKGKHLSKGKISPDAKAPEHYLSGGLA